MIGLMYRDQLIYVLCGSNALMAVFTFDSWTYSSQRL
jgi:hypothetical protein